MANTGQNDRRKGIRREKSRRKTGTKTIKPERKDEKEQQVTVRHESAPLAKEKSTWSWHEEHEEFAVVWSETFLTKKKGKNPKEGE